MQEEIAAQLSSHSEDPAVLAQNAELIKVINGILLAHGGSRWVDIYQC